jgi:hypothetical protein
LAATPTSKRSAFDDTLSCTSDENEDDYSENNNPSSSAPHQTPTNKKRKGNGEVTALLRQELKGVNKQIESSQSNIDPQCEFFGKYVGQTLTTFAPQTRMKAINEIQNVLFTNSYFTKNTNFYKKAASTAKR